MQRNGFFCVAVIKSKKESFGAPMSQVQTHPTLVEQVVNAIVSEIVDGELPANARLIQDELAKAYGVSRQPVQQALLLLRDRGLVREAPGRGLIVSPLDVGFVRNLYDIRAMLDGLAGAGPGPAIWWRCYPRPAHRPKPSRRAWSLSRSGRSPASRSQPCLPVSRKGQCCHTP